MFPFVSSVLKGVVPAAKKQATGQPRFTGMQHPAKIIVYLVYFVLCVFSFTGRDSSFYNPCSHMAQGSNDNHLAANILLVQSYWVVGVIPDSRKTGNMAAIFAGVCQSAK